MEERQQADQPGPHEAETLEPAQRTGLEAHDVFHIEGHAEQPGTDQKDNCKHPSASQNNTLEMKT
ncbi:hypothetical protein GCM10009113_25320 [Marinobacter szutsaonensis]